MQNQANANLTQHGIQRGATTKGLNPSNNTGIKGPPVGAKDDKSWLLLCSALTDGPYSYIWNEKLIPWPLGQGLRSNTLKWKTKQTAVLTWFFSDTQKLKGSIIWLDCKIQSITKHFLKKLINHNIFYNFLSFNVCFNLGKKLFKKMSTNLLSQLIIIRHFFVII